MPAFKSELSNLLSKVSTITNQHNLEAYVVGGFVRDWLLGRDTYDIDITVGGKVREVAQEVAHSIDGKYVLLNDANNMARVIAPGFEQTLQLDFTEFSGELIQDLERRDFTINAIAIDLSGLLSGSPQLIDPFSGNADIKKGLIKAVNSRIFEEDPIRLLRAIRFAAELGFEINPVTEKFIQKNCRLIRNVPGEKLRDELLRLLSLHCFYDQLRYMDKLQLLTEMIPELTEMKCVTQPKEHCWDVFNHSLETVAAVEFLFYERDWNHSKQDLRKLIPLWEYIDSHFEEKVSVSSSRKQMLKLAALLHDVAKPQTKTIEDTGRIRFIGHPREGADKVDAILNRLRFSSRETRLVKNLVYYHLRPVQMANVGMPSSRAIYRFFRDSGGDGLDILVLALADYLATTGPEIDVNDWKQHNDLIAYIMKENCKQQVEVLVEKLINGYDLMNIFSLTQGQLIGKLLDLVREAQATGEISTRDDAISLVRKELEMKPGGGLNNSCKMDDYLNMHVCMANELRNCWTIE
jgi:poly(A) polymerase